MAWLGLRAGLPYDLRCVPASWGNGSWEGRGRNEAPTLVCGSTIGKKTSTSLVLVLVLLFSSLLFKRGVWGEMLVGLVAG